MNDNEAPSSEDGSRSSSSDDARDPDPAHRLFDPTPPGPVAPFGTRTLTGPPTFVDLLDPEGRLPHADHAWVTDRALEALAHLRASHDTCGEVRARVVGDEEMAAAHETHSGVPGTTDVLTFDLSDGPGLDVDLLICIDEAERQAAARSHEPRAELLLYILHGVLHCLGFDDHDDEAFARMHEIEDRTLAAIGVGALFAREGSAR